MAVVGTAGPGSRDLLVLDRPRKAQILLQHCMPHEQWIGTGPAFCTSLYILIANRHGSVQPHCCLPQSRFSALQRELLLPDF